MRMASRAHQPSAAGWRLLTTLLVVLVLAGGVCPALYGPLVPHTHLILGGPPPADWEHHAHPSPLTIFFGPPVGSAASAPEDDEAAPATARHVAAGTVVSLYSGDPAIVLSLLAIGVVVPSAFALVRPDRSAPLHLTPSCCIPLMPRKPIPPPPRSP